MEYRLANCNDILQLAEMRWDFQYNESKGAQLSKEEFITYCSNFLQNAFEKNLKCWVVVENNKIISHVFIEVINKIPKPHCINDKMGYLTNMYTLPFYRNKGIGKELVSKAKNWSIEEGLELLIVWPSNKSIPFYERLGFKADNEMMELLF